MHSDPLINKIECLLVPCQLLAALCIHFYLRNDALIEPTVVAVHCYPFCLNVGTGFLHIQSYSCFQSVQHLLSYLFPQM